MSLSENIEMAAEMNNLETQAAVNEMYRSSAAMTWRRNISVVARIISAWSIEDMKMLKRKW